MRVQPSAVVFVVLVLVIGALIMASTSIDPKSGVRPQPSSTPINIWAYGKFVPWKSPDNMVQLEYPDTWLAQQNPQQRLSYVVASPASQGDAISVVMLPVTALGVQNLPANATTADMIKGVLPAQQANAQIQSAEAAGLKGSRTHWTQTVQDPNRGTIGMETDLWFLSLDPKYLLVVAGQSTNADWPKMQPILEHVISTLKVDQAGAVQVMNALLAGATPPATQSAAPQAATPAATKAQ
jgi:hypothetical protein